MSQKVKFSTQVEDEVLSAVKEIAKSEGRQLQSVIEEALVDLVEKKSADHPRKEVMRSFSKSLSRFDDLYKELAK